MGMYDKVFINDSINIPKFEGDPEEKEWQTKDLQKAPTLDTFKISSEGFLLKKAKIHKEMSKKEKEEVAQEEGYSSWEELTDDHGIYKIRGNQTLVDEVWEYYYDYPLFESLLYDFYFIVFSISEKSRDSFTFHTATENFYYNYRAIFRCGKLDNIILINKKERNKS